jgi:hypothetical protein
VRFLFFRHFWKKNIIETIKGFMCGFHSKDTLWVHHGDGDKKFYV